MKKYLITGLIILSPLALTIAILIFFLNLLTNPFLGIVREVFEHYHLFEHGFLFLNTDQFQGVIAQFFILAFLFLLTMGLGLIARWFFFHTFIGFTDYFVKKIPFVNAIYKTFQDVIQTFFNSDTKPFKQVVLVRFPNPNTYSIGFLTREEIPPLKEAFYTDMVAVFVPTTPNPTSGFLLMHKKEDLIYLEMKVEDAMKFVVSCGVVLPDFAIQQPSQAGSHESHFFQSQR